MYKSIRRLSRHDAPSQRDRSHVALRSQSCESGCDNRGRRLTHFSVGLFSSMPLCECVMC